MHMLAQCCAIHFKWHPNAPSLTYLQCKYHVLDPVSGALAHRPNEWAALIQHSNVHLCTPMNRIDLNGPLMVEFAD